MRNGTVSSRRSARARWLVVRFFGMDVKTTVKTWTVMQTLVGLVGFAMASLIFWLL